MDVGHRVDGTAGRFRVTGRPRRWEPGALRGLTLDALHLASADFLRAQKQTVEIASYDTRLLLAARKMGFVVARL